MADENHDNCASCGFNRNSDGAWLSANAESQSAGHCTIRMIDITDVYRTTCGNRRSRASDPEGPVCSLDSENLRVPWYGKAPPMTNVEATCVTCHAHSPSGIALELGDGRFEFCGMDHHSAWRESRLTSSMRHLAEEAEKSYSEMYETSSSSGYYSEVKECYQASIRVAEEPGLTVEAEKMRWRLEHIREVVRR